MNCFIIGNEPISENDKEDFRRACQTIGRKIYETGHSLVMCSLFEDSADYWVLDGFIAIANGVLKENQYVTLHYIVTNDLKNKIEDMNNRFKDNKRFVKVPHSELSENVDVSMHWLYCQLEGMEQSHCIISIGGKENGTASLLLACADQKRKLVIPISTFGGAAETYLMRHQHELKEKFDISYVNLFGKFEFISEKLENYLLDNINHINNKDKQSNNSSLYRIFISYSRKRHAEADFVEKILLRKQIPVFRDETDFGAGVELDANIKEQLYKANVCLVLWCAEYACSPWCCDEIEMAMDRKANDNMRLWILCLDDTRIVPRRARKLLTYSAKNREELENCISRLLEHG